MIETWACKASNYLNFNYDQFILAGNISKINTFVALVGVKDNKFTTVLLCAYESAKISGLSGLVEKLEEVLTIVIQDTSSYGKKIASLVCISGAGLTKNNILTDNTDVNWNIDGNEIQKALDIPTLVIDQSFVDMYSVDNDNYDDIPYRANEAMRALIKSSLVESKTFVLK